MAEYDLYKSRDKQNALTLAQLAAPGDSDIIRFDGCRDIVLQYTIASIDTNVVVALHGSNDGTNYFNLDADDANTTQTSDGTYAFRWEGRVKYIKFVFVSESGGTSATIDCTAYSSAAQ